MGRAVVVPEAEAAQRRDADGTKRSTSGRNTVSTSTWKPPCTMSRHVKAMPLSWRPSPLLFILCTSIRRRQGNGGGAWAGWGLARRMTVESRHSFPHDHPSFSPSAAPSAGREFPFSPGISHFLRDLFLTPIVLASIPSPPPPPPPPPNPHHF